jgi:hypothetical protein
VERRLQIGRHDTKKAAGSKFTKQKGSGRWAWYVVHSELMAKMVGAGESSTAVSSRLLTEPGMYMSIIKRK